MSNKRNTCEADRLVGARIRHRRQALGLGQKVLAEALGVSFQQIQKYERGQNRISVSRLLDIAAALDTVPALLLPSDPDAPDNAALIDAANRLEARAPGLCALLADMPTDALAAMERTVHAMINARARIYPLKAVA